MPRRDPETGKFVSGPSVASDGGSVPSGVFQEVYGGMGKYTDVEQVSWNISALHSTDGDTSPAAIDTGVEILDLSEMLDRREELADLLHMDVSLRFAMFQDDDEVSVTPRYGTAQAIINANAVDREILELNPLDSLYSDAGSTEATRTTRDVDVLGRILSANATDSYEDGANSAGGSGSTGRDRFSIQGHNLADPVFDARDDIHFNSEIEQHRETHGHIHCTGTMTFGLYTVDGRL